jgi:hypothetical protein
MASWFVLFDDEELSMDEVAAPLKAAGLKVTLAGDEVTVEGEVPLTVTLEQAGWVREEAAEMAEGHADADRIGRCGTRLVLSWADADREAVTEVLGLVEPALRRRLNPMWVFDPGRGEFV